MSRSSITLAEQFYINNTVILGGYLWENFSFLDTSLGVFLIHILDHCENTINSTIKIDQLLQKQDSCLETILND